MWKSYEVLPFFKRSIHFEFTEITNVGGASAYKYKLGEEIVSNVTFVPENSCYNPSPAPDLVRFFPYLKRNIVGTNKDFLNFHAFF